MDHSVDITTADYRSLAEFRYQLRRFLRFSEESARAAGLEPQQHQLLLAIKGLPPDKKATISEMAERLQLRHHSTVELIDRLEEHQLVQRRRDLEDQRRVLLSLTEQGEQVLQQLATVHLAEIRQTGPLLVQTLSTLLDKNDV